MDPTYIVFDLQQIIQLTRLQAVSLFYRSKLVLFNLMFSVLYLVRLHFMGPVTLGLRTKPAEVATRLPQPHAYSWSKI